MATLGNVPSTENLLGNLNVHRTTFTCNGATAVTVADTNISATDTIIISLNTVGGTVGAVPAVKTLTPGTGFTVAGTASDTSVYKVLIIRGQP
ncbi:MAG: hypothetical protein KGL39_24320 [Patescibacteria group bacterium]|nr:hypothetical protein [Patescibacteria group bacterium]